jgi:phosphoribosylanthranilate isomerase
VTVAVKICGVRTVEAALVAAEAGADMLGFMFAPSRRRIDVATAGHITRALRASPHGKDVLVVGVFVNESPDIIAATVREAALDWVQLSGYESFAVGEMLPVPAIKALRFDGHPSEAEWLGQPANCDSLPVLVDAHVAGALGGTGVVGDWKAAAVLAAQRPVVLAGGLNPDNVGAAVAAVAPWGVDVSSGVETDGAKDLDKIRRFVEAAKSVQRR